MNSNDFLLWWFNDINIPNCKLWFSFLNININDFIKFEDILNNHNWNDSINDKLAKIILYDQIPRFLYLGSDKIFLYDKKALQLANDIAFHKDINNLPILYQYFILEPFYHSENIDLIEKAINKIKILISLSQEHKITKFLEYRLSHFKENIIILKKFGRYPHRNQLLHQKTSLEESLYLANNKYFLLSIHEPLRKRKIKQKINDNNIIYNTNQENTKRKLRILALHGMKQNSSFFFSRTAKVRLALRNYAEIIYLSAPHEYEESNSLSNNNSKQCWWHTIESNNSIEYKGLDKSIQMIENIFKTQGPFDGILGFSQGAGLCGILSAIQPLRSIKFKFIIDISGFPARNTYSSLLKKGIKGIPSIHIYGLDDTLVNPELTKTLASYYSNPDPIISIHEGTHFAVNKWPLNDIATFIKEQHENIVDIESPIDYSKIHEPINGLHRKIDITRNTLKLFNTYYPAGINTNLQYFIENNKQWNDIKGKKTISHNIINIFINSILSNDSIILNISKDILIEDLIVLAFSLQSKNINDKYYYFLLYIYNYFSSEFINILKEIPKLSSWIDLTNLLLIQHQEIIIKDKSLSKTLYDNIVLLFVNQLKEDENIKNQILTNNRYSKYSIGQLEEEGLWPSKCGEESPRIKSKSGKLIRLPQEIAKQLNPLHIPNTSNPDLSYTKGICYHLYTTLISTLTKIRKRGKKDFFANEQSKYKSQVLHSKMSNEGWNELLKLPISSEILYPRPQPVIPCKLEDLDPLLDWLSINEPPKEQTPFTKGTIVPDGRLDLCKQVIGPKGIDPLLHSMNGNEQVKRLLLGNNIIGDSGALSIANAIRENSIPNMDTWYIAGNDISVEGITPICEALYNNTSIKALWLKRNPLLPLGAIPISKLLANNNSIITLDLDNTGILDEGLSYLINGLQSNKTLSHLYIGSNGITIEGAKHLTKYLSQESSQLSTLFLSVNRIGDKGCEILSKIFKTNKNLRRLSLASNRIGDKGVQFLVNELEQTKHPLSLLDLGFTKATWAVRELGNRIGDEGAKALGQLLASNTTLYSLYLLNNNITDEGLLEFGKGLENNKSLTSLGTTQFYGSNDVLAKHILSQVENNKRNYPNLHEIDLPEHIKEIYSVYRTKSTANEPFLHKFNWLQASDLDIIPDQ